TSPANATRPSSSRSPPPLDLPGGERLTPRPPLDRAELIRRHWFGEGHKPVRTDFQRGPPLGHGICTSLPILPFLRAQQDAPRGVRAESRCNAAVPNRNLLLWSRSRGPRGRASGEGRFTLGGRRSCPPGTLPDSQGLGCGASRPVPPRARRVGEAGAESVRSP